MPGLYQSILRLSSPLFPKQGRSRADILHKFHLGKWVCALIIGHGCYALGIQKEMKKDLVNVLYSLVFTSLLLENVPIYLLNRSYKLKYD